MQSPTENGYRSRAIGTIPIVILVVVIGIVLTGCDDEAGDDSASSPTPKGNSSPAADTPEPPRIESDDLTVYFPRQPPGDHEYDAGAPVARLTLDEAGCLRAGEDGPVIIWPHSGFRIELIDDEVALVNDDTDSIIAHVGDNVSFHGSDPEYAPRSVPSYMLWRPLPEACANANSYFITGPDTG